MGEVEKEGRVLILKRIHVTYTLRGVTEEQHETVLRVLDFHQDHCPVARSIAGCIEITTSMEFAAP